MTDQIKDILVDIRCAYRDGLTEYAMKLETELLRLSFSSNVIKDKYGYYHGWLNKA